MEERQQNYTISESYELPSKGQIYDVKVNPIVELRSMTARDEMKRLSPSATPLKNLADIIEGCMIEKPAIHVYDMAVGDYEYLLHKLRIVTYGPEYQISIKCPHCGEDIDTITQLDAIDLKPFNIEEFNALRTIILPVSNKEVKLTIQTPRILDSIDSYAKDLKRKTHGNTDIDFNTYAQLSLMIATVDNQKLSSVDMDFFINELPAKDMTKIINTFNKLNAYIGLDNIINLTCNKCGEDVTTFFRFGTEFFRPSNI